MHPRDDRGQASLELVGIVAVVALVLVAAGAIAAIAAPGFSNRVTTAMQRALCTVAGRRCATLDREPCPTLRTDRTLAARLGVAWFHIGDDRAIAIERRSDGSYVIQLVEGVDVGADLSAERGGAEASIGASGGARAGRTYTAPDQAAAQALVKRLRKEKLPGAATVLHGAADLVGLGRAEPNVDTYDLSGKGAISAAADLGLGPLLASGAEADASTEIGLRVAAHRKEATAFVHVDGRIGAFFDVLPAASLPSTGSSDRAVRGRPASGRRPSGRDGAADGGDDPLASVVNPEKLSQTAEVYTGGTVAFTLVPGPRIVGMEVTGVTGTGARSREVHARFDLEDPAVLAAVQEWRRDPTDPARLSALAHAAGETAAIDERRYAIDDHDKDYGIKVGSALDISAVKGLRTSTLVEQRTRPVGGIWETRLDCQAAVG
ncbi:MAG: hypothetical protein PGN13_02135 [Patulibacter minatonensis]